MKLIALATLALGSSALIACTPSETPGARPQEMSAAQHEQAAQEQQAEAARHAAQYNPNAQAAEPCLAANRGYGACWTSSTNPTKEHAEEAEKHRKMAADHRAASQALSDAEAWACTGISPDDRDTSPFDHREDITSIQPAYVHISGKQPRDQLVGAVVTFRAAPGMTAEWLQRVVDCHIARNIALGNDVPEMPYCPLVAKNITATASSARGGFAVRIESQDSSSAKEVLRRAQSLKGAA